MRILFVSNLFPPRARGGYEQWCEEVAVALAARGHQLCILTTRAAGASALAEDADQPFPIYRLLQAEVEGGLGRTMARLVRGTAQVETQNQQHIDRIVQSFQPDAGLIWGMWNVGRSAPQRLEALLGDRIGYYFCDYWASLPSAYVQRLQEPARHAGLQWGKAALARSLLPQLAAQANVELRFPHPVCVSRAVRDILVNRGVPIEGAQIIYGGTALAEAGDRSGDLAEPLGGEPLRLLYLGRLEPIKGVHTLVEAMRHLQGLPVTLDIVGGGEPDYVAELAGYVQQHGLSATVRFAGSVARAQVPEIMTQHHVLIFPSQWEEPFARSVLEAMAAGLAVVGTTTGGTGEILVEGQTGLTFAAGDSEELAGQIRRLVHDPALRRRLAVSACRLVRERFTLGRMVDELESTLHLMAAMPAPPAPMQAPGQATVRRNGS